MAAKFVSVDHDPPLLMPTDLRDWVPEGRLVHFIMDAVRLLDVGQARVNERGTGNPQYPPTRMLGQLIYSYATGTFSSRQIERATYENLAVRLLCADRHPEHDSICTFRRNNGALLQSGFEQVLAMAAQMRVLKVGQVTLAIDGTKILANRQQTLRCAPRPYHRANRTARKAGRRTHRQGRGRRQRAARRRADFAGGNRPAAGSPRAVARCQRSDQSPRKGALREGARGVPSQGTGARRADGKEAPGARPEAARGRPPGQGSVQFHRPVEPDHEHPGRLSTKLQRASRRRDRQPPVGGVSVTDAHNDKEQLGPTLAAVGPVIGSVGAVLVDSGFYSAAAVAEAEQPSGDAAGPKIYAATERQPHGRTV
jgi:transposase